MSSNTKTSPAPEYQKNHWILESDVNVRFGELLEMTDKEFEEWAIRLRSVIKEVWDTHGCPPRVGKTEEEIIDSFNKMETYPIHNFEYDDELSSIGKDVIVNKSRIGTETDQWFSTMFKTRINYTEKDVGFSIYDLVSDQKYLDKFLRVSTRHYRKDSFYNYAPSCQKNSASVSIVEVETGNDWLTAFFTNPSIFSGFDFFLEQVSLKEGTNTGYHQIDQSNILTLSKTDLLNWKPKLKYRHHSTFDINNLPDDKEYSIRIYNKEDRIFPRGFTSFRIGYIQPAVNFPPLTAKYLYERFTEHFKDQERIVIYDPSAGWGGRILGAMSCSDDRNIHYVGTDPNTDNYPEELGECGKYGNLAEFYNTKTYRGNSFFSRINTYEIYRLGSEVIGDNERFSQYKGLVDLVFTSPPYFNREAYSADPTQSYKKFPEYESWRDGFLRPTLTTAVEYLKNDRYLLWNISDVLFTAKGKFLPLEQDSRTILEELGMVYKFTIKMALEGMPGQNRMDENGNLKCKNSCKVDGKIMKYEPIFVFYKPRLDNARLV